MIDIALLKKLCLADGISGDEGKVRDIIIEEIKDFAEYHTDNLGNLIVHKKGKARAKSRLMLSAHMDEVGLMVTDVTSNGYLKFDEVGGIDRRVIVGRQVTVGENKIRGVIGVKPIHLCKGDDSKNISEYSDMYIDIGADSLEEALAVVNYGDSVHFVSEFIENGNTVNVKAIDDRFGCYVLIELIKSELEYDMDFAFGYQLVYQIAFSDGSCYDGISGLNVFQPCRMCNGGFRCRHAFHIVGQQSCGNTHNRIVQIIRADGGGHTIII